MELQNLSNTQPLGVSAASAVPKEDSFNQYRSQYMSAYVPVQIYDQFCRTGYCQGRYTEFLTYI